MFETELARSEGVWAPAGRMRRREWSAKKKAQIIAESQKAGAVASDVARRYGLSPQQLFVWRHEAKKRALALAGEGAMAFVPMTLGKAAGGMAAKGDTGAAIEIELSGAVVRAQAGMDLRFLSSVLRAIRCST